MLTKLWPVIRWCLINSALMGFLVAGMVYDIAGARYVGLFCLWVCIVLSLSFCSKGVLKTLSEHKDWPSVPPWLNGIYDVGVIILIVWYGWFVTASCYLVQSFLEQYALEEVAKIRQDKDKEKS
jgi:hypothetical protein